MTVKLFEKYSQTAEKAEMLFTLGEVADAVGGICDRGADSAGILKVVTDSREDCEGALFVAIRGENFDGHEFVETAFKKGAVVAIISENQTKTSSYKPVIEVEDTIRALGDLAAYHRSRLNIPVIGITGSFGKTTTKELLGAALSGRYRVQKPIKSYNNIIGVSLTILGTYSYHDVLIVEIGTNAPGEIAQLSEITRPEIAIITGIGHAHLEKLGSLDGVKREKASIIKFLEKGGILVTTADCVKASEIAEEFGGKTMTVGLKEKADRRIRVIGDRDGRLVFSYEGFEGSIPVAGEHNAINAGLAAAAAEILGLENTESLRAMSRSATPRMRMEREVVGGVLIINDTYNSNFESLKAAVKMLDRANAPGRKIIVCGDMLELGPASEKLHRAIGWHIARSSIDILVTVGHNSKYVAREAHKSGTEVIFERRNVDEVGTLLARMVKKGDMVLFKASRGIRLESAVKRLRLAISEEMLVAGSVN